MTIGEATKATVEALKAQPSTFAMIVMSFGLLGYTWYEGTTFAAERKTTLNLILEHQRETQQILARSVEPAQVATIIQQLELNRVSYNEAINRSYEQSRVNGAHIDELIKKIEALTAAKPQ